jgi:broad specificity phosphatase PhoE
MPRDYASLQRKPFLAPIWLSILSAFIAAVFSSVAVWAAWVWATADCTTIIVVRHAEKVMVGSDPPLAPAGEARAQLLSRMFGDTRGPERIDAIYASSAQRSRLTAAPLAARLGIIAIVASADPRTLAHRVLREHAGGRVMIVGHGDTVPAIVRALSGAGNVPPLSDDDYGTMYIVSVPRIGHANVLRVNY